MAGGGRANAEFTWCNNGNPVAGTVVNVVAGAFTPKVVFFAALNQTAGANAFLQIFTTAAANVTLGTTTPNMTIGLPNGGGISAPFPEGWLAGDKTGLSVAGTTTATGSAGSNITVNFIYGF